jgi:hypothetical protein
VGATLNSEVGSLLSNATVLTADGLVNLFNGAVTLETLLGGGTVTLDTTVLTLNNGTFSGVLNNGASNVGGLLKASGGLLTLSGNSGYTGATGVNAGTLTLASGGTLASGTVGVSVGATLNSEVGSLLSNATVLTADGLVNLFNGAVTLETLLGGGTVTLDTTVLTLNNGTFSGVLNNGASNVGGLLKASARSADPLGQQRLHGCDECERGYADAGLRRNSGERDGGCFCWERR